MKKTTITRYLRIDKLIPALKERLDKSEIGIRAAEALSFLKEDEQEMLDELLEELPPNGRKVSIKQSDELKEKSGNEELTKSSIIQILKPRYFDSKVKPVKLSGQFLSKHFKPEQSSDEIEKIIHAALDMYFATEDRMEKIDVGSASIVHQSPMTSYPFGEFCKSKGEDYLCFRER